ncbi:stereocilin [Alosa pseudoharengus]|uniref:stereocilin n=1 Tax=Alosa pseudoharengus TaxID=34774 RepID=UPI003F8BADFD
MGKLRSLVLLLVSLVLLVSQIPAALPGGSREAEQREAILKELLSIWRNGGSSYPRGDQPHHSDKPQDQQVQTVVRNIVGGLKSLGLLSPKNMGLPSLNKPIDRQRLSGFLYNISTYLQEMGAELEERQPAFREEQFWEKILYTLLQAEGGAPYGPWDSRVPPRPSFRLQDLFLSLRGSPHWDGLLGLVQSIQHLSERQPQRPILAFVSQNWRTISALLDAVLQAVVSGTYGQASAGLQGFICVLRGRRDCGGFSTDWLEQLLGFLETRNWKPVLSLHPSDDPRGAGTSVSTGRLRPFSLPPEAEALLKDEGLAAGAFLRNQSLLDIEKLDSVQALLLRALWRSSAGERAAAQLAQRNPALLQSLDGLRSGLLHRVGNSVYGSLRRKVSRVTMALLDDVSSVVGVPQPNRHGRCIVGDLRQLILWGIRHNLTWNAQALGFTSHGPPSRPTFLTCPDLPREDSGAPSASSSSSSSTPPTYRRSRLLPLPEDGLVATPVPTPDPSASEEILEAACNDSIPGLTGVSNFTVFLYCNLFTGSLDANSELGGPDLHVTCSDAAWYLAVAEEDFLWVQVCSEFFAHEFNNTVCANSSFWVHRAQQAALTKDYGYLSQSSISELCVQLTGDAPGASAPDASQDCLALLGSPSMNAHDFRRCFLPNDSALILSLCGNGLTPSMDDGSWVSEYCSRVLNTTRGLAEGLCDYRSWDVQNFANATLLEVCVHTPGLRDYMCSNASLYAELLHTRPSLLLGLCLGPAEVDEGAGQPGTSSPGGRCALQQFFDLLPAPYAFDTSQLCADPVPLVLDALQSLSRCEGTMDERASWLATVSYVLRVLDFMVGLSAGLEEGEREVRQGLGQAILLASLLDNGSFWATLRPNASLSVLHTVGVFLRKEQNPAVKEDLLSCFSPVLWDLIQRQGNSSALRVLIQEYLKMPREGIQMLVMSAEKDAVKRFLSHVHQSWDQLDVVVEASPTEQQAMETMTAAFIQKFPRVTPDLFVDLSQFIPFMSVSDIMSFPASLMVNDSVLLAIREHSSVMKSPQKQAFVKRLLQSPVAGEVASWPHYFLTSILPLLPHLPLGHFQQLTAQQLTPLLELLGNSSLDATRGHHVLRTVYPKKRNLTNETLLRLGVLVCYLSPEDLRPLLSSSPPPALWQRLASCVTDGLVASDGRLSHWLGLALESLNASALSPAVLASLRGLLPQLGADFLMPVSSAELLHILTQPDMPTYTPAQAFQILERISENTNLSVSVLCQLRPLLSGLSAGVLRDVLGPEWGLLGQEECQCWRPLLFTLRPAHRALLQTALREGLDRRSANMSLHLRCLLPHIPLKRLMTGLGGEAILTNLNLYRDLPWSPQQAQLLFRRVHQVENITLESVRTLGRIARGMSCDWLMLWTNDTGFPELLQFVSKLPGQLRPALRKCMVEELRRRPEMDLNELDPSFSATLPMRMLDSLANTTFFAILEHIRHNFTHFLTLPRHKQMALADKAVDMLGISQQGLTGSSLDLLGPLLPFLDRATLRLVDREALRLRLEELKGYCVPQDSLRDLASLLTEKALLGEPGSWNVGDVEHVGRLVFALTLKQIRNLPLNQLGTEVVEQTLQSQWRWEESDVGQACGQPPSLRDKIHTFIHKLIKGRRRRQREPVPTCADIKGTFPSAWHAAQYQRMADGELQRCVEFVGRDPALSPDQRWTLWSKLRQSYRPVRVMRPEQVLQLGSIITELGERELQALDLSDLGLVAHLGSLQDWSPKKMRAALLGILRRRGQRPEQLGVAELASFGHLICGFSIPEIARLDPHNLSLAVLFLRELALPCSEQQLEAVVSRLASPLAFGPISGWTSDVFTEIGTLAVGLEDMLMSALVKDQIQGLTPAAIALIPPHKLSVVLSTSQLSWLGPEQASAVTEEQWAELDSQQKQALNLALYEGEVILEHRGRNGGVSEWPTDSFTVCSLSLCCILWHLL